jgi:hypothetical protein
VRSGQRLRAGLCPRRQPHDVVLPLRRLKP